MNFGQNLYQWFLSNAQSLVLMAIVVIGIYLGFKREFSKQTELEADDKARALHLRTYIALGTKAGSTDLENAEKD